MESVTRDEELRGMERAKQQRRVALAVGIAVVLALMFIFHLYPRTPGAHVTPWDRYGPGLLVSAVAVAIAVALLTQRSVREISTGAALIALLALVSVAFGALAQIHRSPPPSRPDLPRKASIDLLGG